MSDTPTLRDWMAIVESAGHANVPTTLGEIMDEANRLGVTFEIETQPDGSVSLTDWNRHHNLRAPRGSVQSTAPKGTGAVLMNLLCAFADQHGKVVTAAVDEDHHALLDYYKTFGFRSRGRPKHGHYAMVRQPSTGLQK